MESTIPNFITYLEEVKNASASTVMSYQRDLKKMFTFLHSKGIERLTDVTSTSLNSYVLFLEREGFSSATVSRNVASMKSYFRYVFICHEMEEDPAEIIRAPHIEKKAPEILTQQDVFDLLESPVCETPKGCRDKAMLELLYATGMRVSELLAVQIQDLNLDMNYIICRDSGKERAIPFGSAARKALLEYIGESRENLLKGGECSTLFVNCSGRPMSRQGFWKCTESAYCEGYYAPYTAAFLCGSFGAEWCGAESSAGNAGAFRYFYHPNVLEYGRKLYAGVLCESASPEMSGDAVQQ